MRSIYPIMALVITTFTLSLISCNKEDSDNVVTVGNGVYTFSLNQVEPDFLYTWSADDAIGIFAYKSGTDEIFSGYSNKQYKVNNNNFFVPATNEDIILRPFMGEVVDFVAYYPYRADVTDKYLIDVRNQSDQKNIDFLYSNNASKTTNASAEAKLIFDHLLSKIVIHSTPGEGYTSKELEGMSITINNVLVLAVFDIKSEIFDLYPVRTSIMMNQTGLLSEAIVLPESSENVSITIQLTNSNIYETKFPDAMYFKEKTKYHFDLRINRTSVVLNPIEIEDWTGGNEPPDTCVSINCSYEIGDFYPVHDDPSAAIGIVCWLKPGTDGREGKIASFDTEILKWSESNNNKLGTSITVGTANAMIISNVDPTLQQFPAFKWCADKGQGWYLPAKYELHIMNEQWIQNKNLINNNILLAGGELFADTDIYLSSSESRDNPHTHVETYDFYLKDWPVVPKTTPVRIRAVKIF